MLFLTSNCIGQFDEAVTNRVSLVVEFKDLEREGRKKLRLRHQDLITGDESGRYRLYDDAMNKFAEVDESEMIYNGREIKNCNIHNARIDMSRRIDS